MVFKLEIPYLEYAFGTKYFVMDRITGSTMAIYDDRVKQIELKGQLKPFNINQLDSSYAHPRSKKTGVGHIFNPDG